MPSPRLKAPIAIRRTLPGLVFCCIFSTILCAQTPPDPPGQAASPPEPQTRADLLAAQRRVKAAAYHPESHTSLLDGLEKFVSRGWNVWDAIQNGTHGLSANIGGLSVGSQIAIGPEYIFKVGDYYKPQFIWDSYAVGAGDSSFRMQTGIVLPRMNRGNSFFSFDAYRYEYTRLLYFGPGNQSQTSGKSDYSQRESGFEFRGGIAFHRHWRVGMTGNFRAVAIGPGTDPSLRPTDALYAISNARGIDRQTDFLVGGFFAEYDTRDQATDPHRGTYVTTHFQNINGSRRALGGFNQYDFEASYYKPFWNKTRTVAVRGKASLTTPHENTFVPFYLEPRLGGSDDLRGFSSFRFHDQNAAIVTVEYRWTLIPVLDMALFADAGKVYPDADQFSISHIKTDVGFGVRGRSGNTVPFRFDVGFSREGVQFWLIIANML